ncbi:MAG: EthD family reductase, partial [Planctomycetota bacterium]
EAFEKHYFERHVPLNSKTPGLKRTEVSRVTGSPMGEPRYYLMAEMYFDDMNAFKAAMKSPEAAAAGKDLMSFARGKVDLMVAEVQEV